MKHNFVAVACLAQNPPVFNSDCTSHLQTPQSPAPSPELHARSPSALTAVPGPPCHPGRGNLPLVLEKVIYICIFRANCLSTKSMEMVPWAMEFSPDSHRENNFHVLSVYFLAFSSASSQCSLRILDLTEVPEKTFWKIPSFSFMKLLRVLQSAHISLLLHSLPLYKSGNISVLPGLQSFDMVKASMGDSDIVLLR